jgi:hypothetical protein
MASILIRLSTIIMVAVSLTGCGDTLNGTYSGAGQGFLDKLTFMSDGTVEVTFMQMTKEGTYAIDGKKVKITLGDDTHVLTLDDRGCLDGGGMLGIYCTNGGGGRRIATGSGLLGVYKAGDSEASIMLDFQNGQKVRVTIAEAGGGKGTAEGAYEINGQRITLTVPGGMPLVLTHRGEMLEGSLDGHSIKFVKR